MKATIWNDFCQMIIVVVGLLCVIVLGAIKVGGMDDAWKVNEAGGRIVFDESVAQYLFEITYFSTKVIIIDVVRDNFQFSIRQIAMSQLSHSMPSCSI